MKHTIYFSASQQMSHIEDESIDLVVTSPPYPMIEMWDELMSSQNSEIAKAIATREGMTAFELMHEELDKVWSECYRVLKRGSFLCVNIGDATRTINGRFALYNNHSRVVAACTKIGFTCLPNILWRKQTNAPNKFMGSGMLPCGAYVTLEHEWILIFRKGEKKEYRTAAEKQLRRESSFFWEERNIWFSDLWDIKGAKQMIQNSTSRERNASFPLEIPFRLIHMYSQRGDIVLDPFIGLGTTSIAAILCERNSVGYEIDASLKPILEETLSSIKPEKLNQMIDDRYRRHISFVEERTKQGKAFKYDNEYLNCKVMTKQETDIVLNYLKGISFISSSPELCFNSEYTEYKAFPTLDKE